MSTQCDRCNTNLPWKFDTKTGHLNTESSEQPFSRDGIAKAFQNLTSSLGVVGVAPGEVPLFNLCEECWAQEANIWIPGEGAKVYKTIPAKTANTGVYFNNQRQDYKDGQNPDIDKIVSTCVHEMMHYWSHNHAGLQNFEMGKKVHWDECVTDFLGRKVYFKVYGNKSTYKTSYGTMSEFIKKQVTKVFSAKVPGFKLNPLVQEQSNKPVPPFAEAFANLQQDGKLKVSYSEASNNALAKMFITWYLKGTDTQVAGHTIESFLKSKLGDFLFSTLNDSAVGYGQPTSLHSA